MPISVSPDPALQARLDQEARRLGVTQSAFIKDALERVLELKSPASLLQRVRSNTRMGKSQCLEKRLRKGKGQIACEAF